MPYILKLEVPKSLKISSMFILENVDDTTIARKREMNGVLSFCNFAG